MIVQHIPHGSLDDATMNKRKRGKNCADLSRPSSVGVAPARQADKDRPIYGHGCESKRVSQHDITSSLRFHPSTILH